MLKMLTCYRVDIKTVNNCSWTGFFCELPSSATIREALILYLKDDSTASKSPLDVIDSLDSLGLLQEGVEYRTPLHFKAYTPSGWTYLGDLRITVDVSKPIFKPIRSKE